MVALLALGALSIVQIVTAAIVIATACALILVCVLAVKFLIGIF